MDQLRKFDMSLSKGLVELKGNKLPHEEILFATGKDAQGKGEWNMNRAVLLSARKLETWTLLVPGKFKRDATAFLDFLKRSAQSLQFQLSPPTM